MRKIPPVDMTEQSFQVGRFIGILRQMEDELLDSTLEYEASLVEGSLTKFIQTPAHSLGICQMVLIEAQKKIALIGRQELLEDIREVFETLDIPYLREKTLHEEKFYSGYSSQLDYYQ